MKNYKNFKYLSKEELDLLNYDEIDELNLNLIKKISHENLGKDGIFADLSIEGVRYYKELEIYKNIRFKEKEIRFHKQNIKDAKDWEDKGGDLHDTTYKMNKLISDVLQKNGLYFLYDEMLKSLIDDIGGGFEYIKI